MSTWTPDLFLSDEAELDEHGLPARARAAKTRANPKDGRAQRLAEIVELTDGAAPGSAVLFRPSLNATSEERAYIEDNLRPFFDTKVITDVTRRVKGGKEANVYCCAAHPSTGLDLVAAKLYRPRQFRSLKNDAQYRQGRALLDAHGNVVDPRDWRLMKAVAGKSRKGLQAQQTSWLEYEYQMLARLHAAGADVPRPVRHGGHTLLMEYIGDETMPAPALIDVTLTPAEAARLFERLVHNVGLLLREGWVHGDLSAYNVLYWGGEVTLIDFPQVVDVDANPDARAIFGRDVARLCGYFARYGVRADARALARDLWRRHLASNGDGRP